MAITWFSNGHHDLMALLILKNSKEMANFGMECAISENSWQTSHKKQAQILVPIQKFNAGEVSLRQKA